MILQYTGDQEGWYYFFENKEVYEELAAAEAYTRPTPVVQALLSDKLRQEPEKFEICPAQMNEYYHFKFRYLEEQVPEAYLPYRILYYRWDDAGYFYMVNPEVFKEKTIPETGNAVTTFEAIPLAQEKELLAELHNRPDKFAIIQGTADDFFYRKFRIKSM